MKNDTNVPVSPGVTRRGRSRKNNFVRRPSLIVARYVVNLFITEPEHFGSRNRSYYCQGNLYNIVLRLLFDTPLCLYVIITFFFSFPDVFFLFFFFLINYTLVPEGLHGSCPCTVNRRFGTVYTHVVPYFSNRGTLLSQLDGISL